MKKRIIAVALIAVLAMALAACGKKETKKKATELCTLGQYKNIEVEKLVIEVSDDDVTKNIYSAMQNEAESVFGHKKVALYDVANIDFEGFLGDVAFEGGKGTGYDLLIGSGTFIPGFEEGLIGADEGTTVKVFVTFPEDYGNADLAGKDATFVCTINKVSVIPEFTDEFIAEKTSYKTFAEYQASVRSALEENAASQIESKFKSDVIDKIIEGCTFDETLADDAKAYATDLKNLYTQYAASYQWDLETFLYYFYGISLSYFEESLPEIAEYNVKVERILDAVAEVEKLEVSDEEYNEEVQKIITDSSYTTAEEVEEAYTKEAIVNSIKSQKAEDIIFNSAVAK
ncbi:MAG: trigger factor [Lachnospiraceae bacterium]|nr:trigger factor [Lachnospiraceae bacterium]MBP5185355.1 trigger factor [Lachnospiraceae bacterium]